MLKFPFTAIRSPASQACAVVQGKCAIPMAVASIKPQRCLPQRHQPRHRNLQSTICAHAHSSMVFSRVVDSIKPVAAGVSDRGDSRTSPASLPAIRVDCATMVCRFCWEHVCWAAVMQLGLRPTSSRRQIRKLTRGVRKATSGEPTTGTSAPRCETESGWM
jgi:hypothetical protein